PAVGTTNARPVIEHKYNLDRSAAKSTEELIFFDGTPHPDGALIQTFSYDFLGRLTEHRLGPTANPAERRRKIVYNAPGIVFKEIDFRGNVTRHDYDGRMLPTRVTRGWGTAERSVRSVRYNRLAEPVEWTDGRGFLTRLERDGFGRLRLVRDPEGNELEL